MKRFVSIFIITCATAFPVVAVAAPNATLKAVYEKRPDLQRLFEKETYLAKPDAQTFLISLEDWARQYGWRERNDLAAYAPKTKKRPARIPKAAAIPKVTADAYVVIDRASGLILADKRAGKLHPVASLTKLVTAGVALDKGVKQTSSYVIRAADDVGGARLSVDDGTGISGDDLFFSTLVASANNAANALARSAGLSKPAFIEEMNLAAKALGLTRTTFVDPSGIETENTSTPREMALIAEKAFARPEIRRYTTTAARDVRTASETKRLKNTNWMLWKPEYDDLYVTGGKTGFLNEAGWNLAVALKGGNTKPELLLVTFGSDTREASFLDARKLAQWTWKNHRWTSAY